MNTSGSVMSQDQVMAQLRQILPAVGWVLIFTGKVSPETWGQFMAVVPPAIGGVMVLGAYVWAIIANTRASIVKSVVKMDTTTVSSGAHGTATVVIHDVDLATTAKEAATPGPSA
jgi:hypothetical protein